MQHIPATIIPIGAVSGSWDPRIKIINHTVAPSAVAAIPPTAVSSAAGGAGAAVYAEANPYYELWSNSSKLIIILQTISNLSNLIYKLYDAKAIAFYMKGGNAIPLIKKIYNLHHIVEFPSDFDLTVLISPNMGMNDYNVLQANVLSTCIEYLIHICGNKEITKLFYNKDIHNSANPIRFHDVEGLFPGGLTPNPNAHLNAVFARYRGQELPKECPFELFIRTNTIIGGTILDVGMIAFRLRQPDGRNLELFDISFTLLNPTNPTSNSTIYVKRDWNMTNLLRYTDPSVGLDVMIYDPFTAFVDMRIAARRNTRANKRAKRLARANNLRQTFRLNSNEYKPRRNATRKLLSYESNVANILNV